MGYRADLVICEGGYDDSGIKMFIAVCDVVCVILADAGYIIANCLLAHPGILSYSEL